MARAEEVASPSSVLEAEALLLNYALLKIGTSLMNRTSVVAVRSRNAGSTGRGVMLFGALPTESNLVFSRLQGERRRIWLEGRIRKSPDLCKQLTNVSLATGDGHARSHTRHRWPVCCCYQVVKELRTLRRCAGPLNYTKQKARMLARSGPLGCQTEEALCACTSARIECARIAIHWLLMLGRIPARFLERKRAQARRGRLPWRTDAIGAT